MTTLAAGRAPALRARRTSGAGGTLLLLSPAVALLVFACAIPMAIFLKYSLLTFRDGKLYDTYTLDAYRTFVTSSYYRAVLLRTLDVAALTTLFALLLGYPLAYAMWRARPGLRTALAVIVFMPLLVSAVVRTYGWQILLADDGPVNWAVTHTVRRTPVELVFNRIAVVIALVHVCLPFVVFPVFSSLRRVEPSLQEAADDLGASWWTSFRRVTVPLSLPGVIAGAEITATLALGSFLMPAMLGGGRVTILPVTIYDDTSAINWPMAAVAGLVLMVISILIVLAFHRLSRAAEVPQ